MILPFFYLMAVPPPAPSKGGQFDVHLLSPAGGGKGTDVCSPMTSVTFVPRWRGCHAVTGVESILF
jgi:hypothetical protein